MLLTTHITFTEILARLLSLEGTSYLLAHLFGWFVDVDHIIFHLKDFRKSFSRYLDSMRAKLFWQKMLPHRLVVFLDHHNKKLSSFKEPRTFLQEPFGILLALFLSILINSYVPVVFLFLHFTLDSLMKFNKYPLLPFTRKLKYYGFFESNSQKEYIWGGILLFILIIWRLYSGF